MKINKSVIIPFIAGLLAGILLSLVCLSVFFPRSENTVGQPLSSSASSSSDSASSTSSASSSSSAVSDSSDSDSAASSSSRATSSGADSSSSASSGAAYPEWSAEAIYTGGEEVVYNGKIYKAKWWTTNEQPGSADVWEDTLQAPDLAPPEKIPDEALSPVRQEGYKVVGYFPSWKAESSQSKLRYDVLTHVIYAFAIPTADGSLLPLENGEIAKKIIAEAHKNDVKVLLAIGGWSYNDTPLEPTFVSATETAEKREKFCNAIMQYCTDYGFDGIDMDWEHPRRDGNSQAQYEAVMLTLASRLHSENKLLTSAVLSGATPDGNVYYDAAAHSSKVLAAVDWINVMAYDGGDGERHSSYEFAVACGKYWSETRGMPKERVVLGVPFYGRPSWASYDDILKADSTAWQKDTAQINGMNASYNGIDTIKKKAEYAKHLGGIMIWEITQDTASYEKSLMTAIKEVIG